jgi:uncharacterized protein YbjT (DUF2867 family)
VKTNREDRRPIVLVTGATAWQGGTVAKQLMERGRFAVRALSRNPRSEAAQELRDRGAEVVRGDLNDLVSLREAIAGCYGVFGTVGCPEQFDESSCRGLNLVDAVTDAGVGHLVVGAFPPVGPVTSAQARSLAELRSRMEEYARSLRLPVTFVTAAAYYERIFASIAYGSTAKDSDRLGAPASTARVPGVAAEDVGAAIATLFERRNDYVTDNVHLVGDELTPWEYAMRMATVMGRAPVGNAARKAARTKSHGERVDLSGLAESQLVAADHAQSDSVRTRELLAETQSFDVWLQSRSIESVQESTLPLIYLPPF